MSFFERIIKAGGVGRLDWIVTGFRFEIDENKSWVHVYVRDVSILDSASEVIVIEIDDPSEVPESLSSPPSSLTSGKRLRELICPVGCLGVYGDVAA